MSNILLAKAFEGQEVRVAGTPDEPWFVGADVVGVLYPEVSVDDRSHYLRSLPEKWKTRNPIPGGGNNQPILITEPGLYWLIARSNSPRAVPFQDWLFSEVLPSIRKTGRYAVDANDFWNQPTEVALKQAAAIDRMMRSAGGWEKGAAAVFQSRLLGLMGITDQEIAEAAGNETAESMALFRSCLEQLGVSLDESGDIVIDPLHVRAGLRPPVIHRTRDGKVYLAVESPSLVRACGNTSPEPVMALVSNRRGTARFPDGKGSTVPARCRWFDPEFVRTALS